MNPILTWLLWLDANPLCHWILAGAFFTATLATALLAPPARRGLGAGWFALAVTATLFAFRWPGWFTPDELNPDESLIIAGAITLKEHLLHWKYLDVGTHGPVSEYLLVIASWLGAPLTPVTARIAAVALEALALLGVWGTLRPLTSERVARCAVLPGLAFWSLVTWTDFIHYATELPGLTLVSLAMWAVTRPLVSPGPARGDRLRLLLGGVALGVIPLTKFQLIPLGAAVALIVMLILGLQRWRARQSAAGPALLCFLAGGLAPLLLLLVYLGIYGLFGQFWYSYIVSALDYSGAGHHPFWSMPSWFFRFSATAFAFPWFFWGGLAFALLYTRSPAPPALRLARLLGWALLGIAMYCVLRPSREVAHYLHILVVPLTLLTGVVLASAVAAPPADRWSRFGPWVAFALIALLPQFQFPGHPYVGHLRAHLAQPRSAAAEYILERRQQGDLLAMWGWEPRLYVETGMVQGTREAATLCQLTNWPLQSFYVARYEGDLLTRRPAWFVDAVGPGSFVFEDRGTFGHETILPVREIIARDYEFTAELDSMRIYRRKSVIPR
jgi:hypothetical protein